MHVRPLTCSENCATTALPSGAKPISTILKKLLERQGLCTSKGLKFMVCGGFVRQRRLWLDDKELSFGSSTTRTLFSLLLSIQSLCDLQVNPNLYLQPLKLSAFAVNTPSHAVFASSYRTLAFFLRQIANLPPKLIIIANLQPKKMKLFPTLIWPPIL